MKIEVKSKSGELKRKLLGRIHSGHYKSGDKIESVRDLAAEFQVSKHTAEKAVSTLVTEGYFYQEQGRGTFFSGNQTTRKSLDHNFIALHASSPEDNTLGFVSKIIEGCCRAATENRSQVLTYYQKDLRENIVEVAPEFLSGIVMNYFPDYCDRAWLENASEKTRLVFVNNECYGIRASYVGPDNEKGGRMITDYLIKKGHRNISFVSWEPSVSSIHERLTGYKISMASHNMDPANSFISFSLRNESENFYNTAQCVTEILENNKKTSAIICINDGIAMPLCKVLKKMGIRVPDDIAVASFDNTIFARAAEIPLTSVDNSGFEIGYMAGNIASGKGVEEGEIKRILIPPLVVARESA